VSTVKVVTPSGKGGKNVELPAEFFGVKVNIPLIHQVVVAQQAAARQGSHATKTRGAVRGGGRKPYRQKGTGRARQGSVRAPQYAGGGIVHGPVPRSYVQRTPKKMKAAALRGALSDRSSHGRVSVVSGFVEGEQPSTSAALAVLRAAVGETGTRLSQTVLVVAPAGDELTHKSLRNAVGVHVLATGQLNTHDVLVNDHIVFTQAALSELTGEAPAEDAPAKAKPAAKETAAAQDTGAGKDAGAAEDTATAEDAPAGAQAPAKDKAPAGDKAPTRNKAAAKDKADTGDAPAAEDTSAAEAKAAAKDTSAAEDTADKPAPRRTSAARGSAAGADKPEEEEQQ
jgi:large subunit ribosomal protein L4